ncbi:MAG: hypothetical protein RLZZ490_655 [Cyanobacteriota bacterium]|jgi:hypothetical protein
MTSADTAIKILKEAGKPLHYQEITKRILEQSLVSTNGATPHNTLYAVMHLDERQNRKNSRFVKIKEGNKLIDLLIQNELGIKKKSIFLMEIDEDAFIFDLVEEDG